MNLFIGSDHAGFELKEKIRTYLTQKGYELTDCGCFSAERADYPQLLLPIKML